MEGISVCGSLVLIVSDLYFELDARKKLLGIMLLGRVLNGYSVIKDIGFHWKFFTITLNISQYNHIVEFTVQLTNGNSQSLYYEHVVLEFSDISL